MKKFIYVIVSVVLSVSSINAQDYKQAFATIQQEFEQRLPSTQNTIKEYLAQYPYSTYEDELKTMQGVLYTEKEKYKNAIKVFNKVNVKSLSRNSVPMYYFYLGYAHLQQGEYDKALAALLRIKNQQSAYSLQAVYYIGYCYYHQKEYSKALAEFLSIEQIGSYKQIAPYYIVQIYYAQHENEKVYARAEELLKNYPDNQYNDELHRMLGEMYYQDSIYTDAVRHLEAYRVLRQKAKKEIVRNDMYLLGLSHYMTNNYQAAVENLKMIKLEEDSISENTCLHLGHSYLRLDDIEKAKLSYATAIRYNINPEVREEAMYNYVQVTYLQNSALGESVTAFQDFIREYPNSKYISKVYALMADLYLTSKNYKAALDALLTIANPDDKMQQTMQYLRYQLTVDAFVQGKMTEVIHWSNEVIIHSSQVSVYKTEAYYLAAQAHYRLHQYAECIAQIDAYQQQPNATESTNQNTAIYLKAYALFNQKDYAAAEPAFRSYAQLIANNTTNTTYPDALNRIADCLFYVRNFQEASDIYAQVAKLNSYGADYAILQNGYAQGLMHHYAQKVDVLTSLAELYPRSDYADDALYEIARAQLQQDKNEDAISTYQSLLQKYPKSNQAAKSSLELGMTYRTLKQYDNATNAFKTTIERYAGTEEAYAALEGLEQVYVETNNIEEYITYTKTLTRMNMQTASSEDSLLYVTAELQYMLANYPQAAAGFTTYLTRFCPRGRYCTNATYYAANSYYQLKQYTEAIEQYSALADIAGNPYMEEACMRVAELSYDQQEYRTALYYFQRMNEVASSAKMRTTAMVGILRCSHHINDKQSTIDIATQLIEAENLDAEIHNEALYCRGKMHLQDDQFGLALVDFTPLAKDVRTAWGAEAKYQLAYCYFNLNAIDMAEQEIMSFTQLQTSHQYWLAKSLILLADINLHRGEVFQAKQYLLALQSNYKLQDDIPTLIEDKLQQIAQLEQQTTEVTPKTEEETL